MMDVSHTRIKEQMNRQRDKEATTGRLPALCSEDEQWDEPANFAVVPRCDCDALSILEIIPRKLTFWQQYPLDSVRDNQNSSLT